ncbi:hypothetical protein [Dyella agri]|uniref:DUF2059 domain-containing protein n=1 Tax=Dyella agri TaxID=1926869 RepID=A0ABW8KCF0_9GAMM
MKRLWCAIATGALAWGCGWPALAQQDASSGGAQLQRMLVDYHLAQIMRIAFERAQAQMSSATAQNQVFQQVLRQLDRMTDSQFARLAAPSVRDCISEDNARTVADFLETDSGRALVAWMIQGLQQPGQAVPKPSIDRKLAQAFAAQGGAAAMSQFGTCVQTPERQQQLGLALVHYATQPASTSN